MTASPFRYRLPASALLIGVAAAALLAEGAARLDALFRELTGRDLVP